MPRPARTAFTSKPKLWKVSNAATTTKPVSSVLRIHGINAATPSERSRATSSR